MYDHSPLNSNTEPADHTHTPKKWFSITGWELHSVDGTVLLFFSKLFILSKFLCLSLYVSFKINLSISTKNPARILTGLLFLGKYLFTNLFICLHWVWVAACRFFGLFKLQCVESSSLTRNRTQAHCIGTLNNQGSPNWSFTLRRIYFLTALEHLPTGVVIEGCHYRKLWYPKGQDPFPQDHSRECTSLRGLDFRPTAGYWRQEQHTPRR